MGKLSAQELANLSLSHGAALPSSVFSNSLPQILVHAASYQTGIACKHNHHREDFCSYRDLLQNAQKILAALRQRNLAPQAQVILQLQNPHYFFASLWGCFLGGYVAVPLGVDVVDLAGSNPEQSKLRQVWSACSSPLIITDTEIRGLATVRVEELLNSKLDNLDSHYYEGQPDDLALLIFTSGSTGKPKGVTLSVGNLLASTYGMAKVNHLSQQAITLNWMPLEHVASLVMFHLTEVYLGCEQIQVTSELVLQNPLHWLDLINQHRVSATWSPNFAYGLVNEKLTVPANHDWDLSCLRWMGNGAEAVVGQTTRRFLDLLAPYGLNPKVVSPGYGMSETCSGIAHAHDFGQQSQEEFISVGAPIPGVSLRIVDQQQHILPEGEIGLLQVKGATVTAGYYQQPELNQELFDADGWFDTGDLGFLTAGKLTITGRQKEVIIINGVNYYSHEIETVVEEIASISLSYTAACGVEDNQQQSQIAIFFHTELQTGNLRVLINQIRKTVFQQLGVSPAYVIPVAKETIPKTNLGKIKRSQLSQRFAAGAFEEAITTVSQLFDQRNLSQQELPGNVIEQQLVQVWQEVLHLATVSVKDNFFELGGNSLLLMQVLNKLTQLTPKYHLAAVDLFQYPTISTLANYLNSHRQSVAVDPVDRGKHRGELRRQARANKDVAIIGMSCRFPGADNIDEFWHNLSHGVESISFFSDQEILDSGVKPELLHHPNYVKAGPILENVENFDANFWGYSPKEARLLEPQQRLFLECAWSSLEDAGCDPLTYPGEISLYGGAATNTYLLNNIYPNRHSVDQQDNLQVVNLSSMGGFQVTTANDKDYLTTRTSYKLNLTGSSINVQTACSTSLVAVHLAYQGLINSECDLALAGGVSVHSPQKMGYLYQEGMILSADGHCRAFAQSASGTIFGSGAGMVVLKLLDRAVEDGDRIYGVIKGSAVNNDGGTKVGYFAPNVDGQTRVVAEALAYADIEPKSVSYIEAHGTGTKLGDPIEIKALTQAYGQNHDANQDLNSCAVGSVKTNVGHLQMASGIVGLIKTTLCLYHQQIPPSLHFDQPNPQIDFAQSPFYINTQLQDWQTGNYPRRAGVNSLGIGGTNAHLVLEEYLKPVNQQEINQPQLPAYLLTLAAKTEPALQELINNYQTYLEAHPKTSLRDICLTSNVGRHHFDYRLGIVVKDKSALAEQLSQAASAKQVQQNHRKNHKIAWLFTGQGSQYKSMAQELYSLQPVFREHCDRCLEILNHDPELAHLSELFPFQSLAKINLDLHQTQYTQPLLFATEYALAKLWLDWGVQPDVLLGHSIGEYVAAAIAGVFSLEDALKLVAIRGKLMQNLPATGAMLAVFKSPEQITDLLNPEISIAAYNGTHIVLSGLRQDIKATAQTLESRGVKTQLLNVAHGFHSPLMQPMVDEFTKVANTISYSTPQIPIVSNLTGRLADGAIATADYWISHILQPVQFTQSIKYLEQQQITILLEIGTKPTLIAMAQGILNDKLDNKLFLPSLNHKQEDWQQILATVAELYMAGVEINWSQLTQNYQGNKVSLPTYPFQRQRYWYDIPRSDIHSENAYPRRKHNSIHPLLGELLSSPLKQKVFQSYLNPETIAWLQEHRLHNQPVLPGTAYIEMVIASAIAHFQTNQLTVKNLAFDSPLYLHKHHLPEIQLILSPEPDLATWEIYSLEQEKWQLHSTGQVLPLSSPAKETDFTDIASIKAQFISAKPNTELNIQQHYQQCRQRGLDYGDRFQGIKQLWAKDNQALGLIELPPNLDSSNDNFSYNLDPALLDSCLQILFAALPVELSNSTYIPIGLDRLDLYYSPDNRVWSYLKLRQESFQSKILVADVWLYSDRGELIAQLTGLKSQAVNKLQTPSVDSQADNSQLINSQPYWHDWLYEQCWIQQSLPEKSQPKQSQASSVNVQAGTWLIFADSTGLGNQLAIRLESQQQKCHLIEQKSVAYQPEAYQTLVQQQEAIAGVIYLWSLEESTDWQECKPFLYLVQALIQHQDQPDLWFVTRNAQPINNYQLNNSQLTSELKPGITEEINNSCLWGMQKAIALENPELNCVGIDLDINSPNVNSKAIALEQVWQEIFANICVNLNEQVGYRDNQRYVARLIRANLRESAESNQSSANLLLQIDKPGDLDSLNWQSTPKQRLQAGEIEIEIKATGLNFRDVMVALDLYPDETKFLGLECAGIVRAIGKEVSNFQVGDQVIAISDHSFCQYLTVDSRLAIHQPEFLNLAEAATIPVTFLTAYYTLIHLAQLQPGEKVLIHAAAGGVGLAAIQIAQNIGAEIFATASPPKWSMLTSLGVTQVMNSRSLDFAEELMSATNGNGVDVVLNSLSGEFIPQSISTLGNQGRFVEIGKQGIWSQSDVAQIRSDVHYSVVDLWQITQNNPGLIQQMLGKIMSQFNSGKLQPLPHTIFTSDHTLDAFRYMQQGKHQGKIVITQKNQLNEAKEISRTTSTGTYLITGGMGAIALEVATWLIDQGVKNLALLGRSDLKPKRQAQLNKLQEKAQVTLIKADVANADQLAQALAQIEQTLPPLTGVIHCAGVLCDRPITKQDWSSFSRVLAPKVQGAWNLHSLTQKYDLENFILFSSASSLLGSAGQSNYCAANAWLDALAHGRRSLGLPAIAINWSAWRNTGLAANPEIAKSLKQKGIGSIKPSEGIEILEKLLSNPSAQIGVIPIDWDTWGKNNVVTPFYSDLVDSGLTAERVANKATNLDLKQQLLNTDVSQRRALLIKQISQQVGNILGIADTRDIDLELGFTELGLDSLSSVELRNKLQSSYKLKLSATAIFDYATVNQLADHLLTLLFDNYKQNITDIEIDSDLAQVAAMSDSEAEALLLQDLEDFEL